MRQGQFWEEILLKVKQISVYKNSQSNRCQMSFFYLPEYTKIAPDPIEELTALPRPPSWFQGATSRHEGNGGKN